MELEKFEQAKKVKENLDRLERQKRKLELALESCSLGVTIEFSPSKAFLSRKDEVSNDNIKEQILKNSPENNEEFFVVPKVIE